MLAFFDKVLGPLQPHHQLPNLGAGERELALLRLAPDAQAACALLEELPLPALQLVRWHLALARDRVEGLPAHQPQHQVRLPRRSTAAHSMRLDRAANLARVFGGVGRVSPESEWCP
jgi:hypothetical protein